MNVKTVSREEKLIAQMKVIEAFLTDKELSPTMKLYGIINTMSYLNELLSNIIQPLREEAGENDLITALESIFVEFINKGDSNESV